MLQDALARDSNSQRENSRPEADTNPGEQKLDGEDFNVINHEDVEDIDDEEDETEQAFYRPGLAGLLGGRMMQRGRKTPGEFDHLHPFTQVLSISNVDDCVKLEAEAFPANERCSKEKVSYFSLFVVLVSGLRVIDSTLRVSIFHFSSWFIRHRAVHVLKHQTGLTRSKRS